MKLVVSNIAWSTENDSNVASILKNCQIDSIELAPSKYLTNFENFTLEDFGKIARHWEKLGLGIYSMQSLLYSLPHLELFGDPDLRFKLKQHLLSLGRAASQFGLGPLVFGAPKNRRKGILDYDVAKAIAITFFQDLSDDWRGDSFIVFEANPKDYECDFITSTSESFEFTKIVNRDQIRNHIDFACTELGGESPKDIALSLGSRTSHIHLSEANLGELRGTRVPEYREFLSNLNKSDYKHRVTLEMRAPQNLEKLEDSIHLFIEAAQGA